MTTKQNDSCLQKAGEDEPIFVLRAQDKLAPEVVGMWIHMAREGGTPESKLLEAYATMVAMEEWQIQHAAKHPD